MSFWDLDDKAQLALLMAGLMGTASAAGCDRRVDDPVPPDAMADARDSLVADMVPPDAKPDKPPVVDPPPPDAKVDVMVSDMAPPDAKPDQPPIADPLPPDATAPPSYPSQRGRQQARPALPLSRNFRTRVRGVTSLNHIEMTAVTRGVGNPALLHKWTVSGGTLERDNRQTVRWRPPTSPGRHMAQVVVRDGHGSIAVDVYLHEVK